MSRMRLGFLGLLLTGLLGCESDPIDMLSTPLPAGAEAMTFFGVSDGIPADHEHPRLVRVELGEGRGPGGRGYDYLQVGTKVRVLEDAAGLDQDGKRLVKVIVLEGQIEYCAPFFQDIRYSGETVAVRRDKLRLLPPGDAPQDHSSSSPFA
jgi:hypothetical protein